MKFCLTPSTEIHRNQSALLYDVLYGHRYLYKSIKNQGLNLINLNNAPKFGYNT